MLILAIILLYGHRFFIYKYKGIDSCIGLGENLPSEIPQAQRL